MNMAEFKVHHIRFFDYKPLAIHCLAYDETQNRAALSRSDGSVEIWSIADDWYQEKVIVGCEERSVEALVWSNGRLFSTGLQGEVIEYDLLRLTVKRSVPTYAGAAWCLTVNTSNTSLAAGTEDGCVVLFDIRHDDVQYERSFVKQDSRILSITWNNAEDRIVTGGIDNIRIWSVESGHAIQRLSVGRTMPHKETIVWCVAVTKDMTIISGDSRGKTSFWNGVMGTKIKSFQSHDADVLTLCLNKEGNSVYSSGIDPKLVQFEYISEEDSDWKSWVKSQVRVLHSHDVRSLVHAGNVIISGGVDCNLVFNVIDGKFKNRFRKIPPIPQTPLVHIAPSNSTVLLQYPCYLELWKLGHTNNTSKCNGEILHLSLNPVKLIQLKARDDERIVCSSISRCGKWVAYSSSQSIRLYQVLIDETNTMSKPVVDIKRIHLNDPELLAAHRLIFTPDSSSLVSASIEGTVQVSSVNDLQSSLICTMTSQSPDNPPTEGIHLLAINNEGTHLATGGHDRQVSLYDLKKKKFLCNLPRHQTQPSALAFSPASDLITVVYCNQKVMEFDFSKREYSAWSRYSEPRFPKKWLHRQCKTRNLFYNPLNPVQFILQDEMSLTILDKSEPFPDEDVALFGKDRATNQQAFHICSKYKYLQHLGLLKDDWLVAVEITPSSIIESLPPTLKQKKFGTS